MDFLSKTLSSFTGSSIPYTIKDQVWQNEIWKLHDGINPKDKSLVSIFEFNGANAQSGAYQLMASNAFKYTKLVKFPDVINVVDLIEANKDHLFIVTERVKPLSAIIDGCSDDYKVFGLNSIINSLGFLNDKCNFVHGNLYIDSVFVNMESNWKLFGFELMNNVNGSLNINRFAPITSRIELSPELKNGDVSSDIQIDSYLLGIFIDKYVPSFTKSSTRRLIGKFGSRLTVEEFGGRNHQLFDSNIMVQFNSALSELTYANTEAKSNFIKYELPKYLSENLDLPEMFVTHKLLPDLIEQFDLITKFKPTVNTTPQEIAGNKENLSMLLNFILKVSDNLSSSEYIGKIFPIIKASFSNNDRSIRLILLNSIPAFKQKLSDSEIHSVFPQLITGIQDSNFVIRELTLNAINLIIDSLTDKMVNQDLLRILAKCQNDPKPSIRTNTIILIVKISSRIYKTSRNNVVITALSKSLKDSFTPCKMAALTGFRGLINEFSIDEVCNKILGILAIALTDHKSSKVRDESRKLFKIYFERVEEQSKDLEDEEDEEAEEKEFLKKYGTNETKESQQQLPQQPGSSFGWGLVSKLVNNVEGSLNTEVNKSNSTVNLIPTEPSERTSTSIPPVSTVASASQSFEDLTVDDGWGEEDGWNDPKPAPKVVPKRQPIKAAKEPVKAKVVPKSSARTTAKGKSLKLGAPKEKPKQLNLNLVDDGDDNWGGSDDW